MSVICVKCEYGAQSCSHSTVSGHEFEECVIDFKALQRLEYAVFCLFTHKHTHLHVCTYTKFDCASFFPV